MENDYIIKELIQKKFTSLENDLRLLILYIDYIDFIDSKTVMEFLIKDIKEIAVIAHEQSKDLIYLFDIYKNNEKGNENER